MVGTLKKLVEAGEIEKDEKTVIYITGNGLKTQDVLLGHVPEPVKIRPDLKEVERLLSACREVRYEKEVAKWQ